MNEDPKGRLVSVNRRYSSLESSYLLLFDEENAPLKSTDVS